MDYSTNNGLVLQGHNNSGAARVALKDRVSIGVNDNSSGWMLHVGGSTGAAAMIDSTTVIQGATTIGANVWQA